MSEQDMSRDDIKALVRALRVDAHNIGDRFSVDAHKFTNAWQAADLIEALLQQTPGA